MVHDLGKLNIPLQILTKEGPLTDEEYDIMKAHPRYSFEILSDNHGVSSMVKQAVLMHHENLNGSGYPLGKAGDDIPLFAKILHVVDVYDALISKRPYKEPYASADALEYIEGGKGILFDPQVVDAMTASVPMYPPGIDVYLSNGEQALVVAYTSNAKRPKVKILATDALVDLSTNKEYQDIYIKSSAAMPQDYVGEIPALNEDRQNVVERRKRIMLVDSMQVSLMQTQAALGHEYDYIICKNGVEALISLSHKAEKPDLVIMDIVMEDMDGIEVAKKIKSRLDDTPMIFLTASGDRETVLACSKVGAVDYILKPAKPVYIRERVAYALKEQRE
jgi:response regulator RpfG family c-di-GMP phosphodiesterase